VVDAIEARARLAGLAEKSGNVARLDYWRDEIIKTDAAAGAGRTDRTRFLAAGARLARAQPARDAFRAVRLTAPLKKSLAAKKQAMETALAGYKAVVAYDIAATTTAATYEMAELYGTLAKDILHSERPSNRERGTRTFPPAQGNRVPVREARRRAILWGTLCAHAQRALPVGARCAHALAGAEPGALRQD
jgi:hypothetical protein